MHIPPELTSLARLFQQAGFALYGVGGMVRGPLLGQAVTDYDVCSAMPPERLLALCRGVGAKAVERRGGLGAVELCFEGIKLEHTTFRAEGYGPGGGHGPEWVRFTERLEEDAFRRDFTVNAIYLNLSTGELSDPTGGLSDLRRGIIRATAPNPEDIMAHDAERILRMCRFAAELGFGIDGATMAAARAHSGGLKELAPARVRKELSRLLLSDTKYGNADGVLTGLTALDESGGLDALLPELAAGRGVAQRADYHRYDVMGHMLYACAAAPPVLELRLAALLHDTGKPVALARIGKMYTHERIGGEMAPGILRRLGYPQHTAAYVSGLILHHMYDLRGEAREDTLRRWFVRLGRRMAHDLTELRRADVHGSGVITGAVETANRWQRILSRMEAEGAPFSERELNISGHELMKALGLSQGPEIGRLKTRLLCHCAVHPGENTPEGLLRAARDMA